MCKTYHWTCNICRRSQSRGQRCSNTLAGTVNCPNNTRTHASPPHAEHTGLRCAYCHTPTLKTEAHFVNPASFATNAGWEPRHAMTSPSRDPNARHQAPIPPIHHRQSPSHPGHAQPLLPHGQSPHHRRPAAPGALPILTQHHHHGPFASPTPPSMPIDPQLVHPHHHAVRAHSHTAAATPPPFQHLAPRSTPTDPQLSPDHARPLHPHASPPTAAAGGGGEGPATGAAPHLRPTADMLASMAATRTALFVQAEARRAAAIETSHARSEGEHNAREPPDAESQKAHVAGDTEVEAAWYAMWAGCGVSPAAISAAQTTAAVQRDGTERKEDGRSHDNQETRVEG